MEAPTPAIPSGAKRQFEMVHGYEILAHSRSASQLELQPALVDGRAGIVLAPRARLSRTVRFTTPAEELQRVVIVNPTRLKNLDLAALS